METQKLMRAVQANDYGDIDEVLSVEDTVKYPSLADLPDKKRKDFMIIKTHAVALACGDCRTLSGLTKEFQGPPSFPYIPGGDCSGVVVEIPEEAKSSPFKVGDRVAARFVVGPRDGLAEYALIHQSVCEKIPDNVSSVEAVALAGACPATVLADRINKGERVLVLGAGGGVGSHVCQLMRERGASYIVGVSRSPDRLLKPPLSYNFAIDYSKEDPFSVQEFKNAPFDVVLDLAGAGGWLRLLQDSSIVKPASQGGRFLTTTPDKAIFEGHNIFQLLQLFLCTPLWRAFKSRTWARYRLPAYTFAMSLPAERDVMTRTMDLAGKGTLKAVIDSNGPFPFTTEGVRAAFRLQESRHAHGKVVVQVSKP
jgi:NADPH:quinone reductase-like Zn-dependent oxidoreductase